MANEPNLADSVEVRVESAPKTAATDARGMLLELIEGASEKNFVFFFGTPRAGKTAVLGSMLSSMQQDNPYGTVQVMGGNDGYFRHGVAL